MQLPNSDSWRQILAPQLNSPNFAQLQGRVDQAYQEGVVYPEASNIWRALDLLEPSDVKVVILGQDPYHGPHQAHGLAFSVQDGVDLPPSLRNIYTEIERDIGEPMHLSGDLTRWAEQGVLLLNSALTVPESDAGGHADWGWLPITDAILTYLGESAKPRVFMLWGGFAKQKAQFIRPHHQVLSTSHPSPLSVYRGFKGCGHFSAANEALKQWGRAPIDWR